MSIKKNKEKKIIYNFGIRKPVLNCFKKLDDAIWKNYLINKWVYEYDSSEKKNVYYKHVFVDSRLLQIVYSGLDILGDGIYTLYKVEINPNQENNKGISVFPIEFKLNIGSFECENYLQRLLDEHLITDDELKILSDNELLKSYTEKLIQINK